MSNDEPTRFYAYGKMNAGIEAVMRLHSVKRWHMIDTTRTQTLAEHSANVAVLAGYIASTAPEMYFGSGNEVRGLAVIHDMPEVFTGDIPTPTKQEMRHRAGLDATQTLDNIETDITPIEYFYRPEYNQRTLIKICDLADGIRFIRLHGVDATAMHARTGLEDQLKLQYRGVNLNWPRAVIEHVHTLINFYAYR